ncbi:type III polyketide synthase [Desulfobacterota bacterium AH_259_B03_O07]|nr:type III polyketide synthase [Desulfobacterota bacterium AH_259_B03_O07]
MSSNIENKSKVISVGIADFPYTFLQSDIRDFTHQLFSDKRHDIDRMMRVFDNSMIEKRHFTQPAEWFYQPHTFVEKNGEYVKSACTLSIDAVRNCINSVGAEYNDFDHIIYISSTGIATPSIDAKIINELRLDPHLKRSPIWGLGCVGGAVGLSRALEYTAAFPRSGVLLIALEICSLSILRGDWSKSNIVAMALFSDGAAATFVAGSEHRLFNLKGINLIDSMSTTYYDSLDVMGWEIVDAGFKAIFSKDIPAIVRKYVQGNIIELLDKHSLSYKDLRHYVIHPGGKKVINAYEEALCLPQGALDHTKKVLREHGNMSSPTVLYVLKEFLDSGHYNRGDYGLISALGPGFSSEVILFQVA